jgi:SnoaL-like domain
MTEADAQQFALEWVESWNSHDLERILSHYSDDVEVSSPLIEAVLGPDRTSLRGKKAVRAYWAAALERYPDLRFILYRAYAGPNSLVLHYQSIQGLVAAECMEFNSRGVVCRVLAHYALGADPVAA